VVRTAVTLPACRGDENISGSTYTLISETTLGRGGGRGRGLFSSCFLFCTVNSEPVEKSAEILRLASG
jgi:hypothetical protein